MSISAWQLIKQMRCPKCGAVGAVTIVEEDSDWWSISCDECDYDDGSDPTEGLPLIFPDWFEEKVADDG
jgi:transcription elongation factor Elf1